MSTAIGIGIGIPFIRPTSGGGGNTPRVAAFLTATGITDATIISALNTMDNALISAGLLPSGTGAGKIKALYPFVGGTASTHKFNFVDPRDLDAAYRLSFFGGWTHSSNGMLGNASNTQAKTNFAMSSAFQNDIHWYTYQRIAGANNGPVIVAEPNSGNINFYATFAGSIFARLNGDTGPVGSSQNNAGGFHASRINSSQVLVGKNGTSSTISDTSVAPNNQELIIGGNSDLSFSSNEFAGASFGEGLNSSQISQLHNAFQDFQTELGRNV